MQSTASLILCIQITGCDTLFLKDMQYDKVIQASIVFQMPLLMQYEALKTYHDPTKHIPLLKYSRRYLYLNEELDRITYIPFLHYADTCVNSQCELKKPKTFPLQYFLSFCLLSLFFILSDFAEQNQIVPSQVETFLLVFSSSSNQRVVTHLESV